MEPDGERVRRHRGQCRELGDVDPEAEEQDDGHGAAPDGGDLQPVDGETVVEARCPEVREQVLIDAGGAAEDDRFDHVAPIARQTRRRVASQPASDAVADAGDAAAPPDHPERLSAQDRVDALPAQPLRLVEAVRRSGRSPQLSEEPEPRALWRRRPSERELQQGLLVGAHGSPAEHEHPHPLIEGSEPRRLLDLHQRPLRRADPGREHAVVKVSQPHASPPPGDCDDGARERRGSHTRIGGCESDGAEGKSRAKRRHAPGGRDSPGRSRGREHRRMRAGDAPSPHGITSPLSCAMCAGPMPGTPSSSATAWNAPCACR